MSTTRADWVDVSFALTGGLLAPDYAEPLWQGVCGRLPWLAAVPGAGIHPLRGAHTEHGVVLSRRSRLQLRLPGEHVTAATALSGAALSVGDAVLSVGAATVRPLQPFPTLGAPCVVMAGAGAGEIGFMIALQAALTALVGEASVICGQASSVWRGHDRLAGFSVVIHELTPAQSLTLQTHGVGAARGLGCGVFVHHKVISGLNDTFDGPD